jgi:hypothetical protein
MNKKNFLVFPRPLLLLLLLVVPEGEEMRDGMASVRKKRRVIPSYYLPPTT